MQSALPAPRVINLRFLLLILNAVLAAILGFFVLPNGVAVRLVAQGGYWFVLVTFGIFLHALGRTFRDDLRAWNWRRADWVTFAVIALGGMVLLVHETSGFKVLMDEISMLGTSMNMHYNKTALMAVRGNDIQGTFELLDGGMLDKRPLFFPFLVSLVHDLTGYRPENAFVVNGILAFVFLGLVATICRKLAGRVAGWLGVALFAGLPLLAQNANGGGFELLNLVMLLTTLLLGVRFVERGDEPSLTAFVFSALLLAQVRYESVLYLVPVALLTLWVWRRDRRLPISWAVSLTPLLMIHYPLQHRIFDLRPAVWELASKPGYSTPFSFGYIPENLVHAVGFFFGRPTDQPNSYVFSVLGWIAVPFFVLILVKRLRLLREQSPVVLTTMAFSLVFAAQFLLLMCYFWGKFDEPVIRRLSLPTHLGLLIALVSILPEFGGIVVTRWLFSAALVGLFAVGVPSMAAHAYSQEYLPGRETAWRREFMKEQPRKDYLVIDNDAMLWVTHKISATPIEQAIKRRDSIAFLMRTRTFSDVYVFQRYDIDPKTGGMTLREGDDLGPDFVLETIREERLQILKLERLSRLKEIRKGGVNVTVPPPETRPVPTDRAAIEQARRLYLENYLKQLP
jgi:hypothetical protein